MHGRLKIRTTEEQAEAKRKEQQEKLKIYSSVTSKIFTKREKREYDHEGLELTARILEQNPDFYTLWNFRREILLALKDEKSKEELKNLVLVELSLTQNCLKTNPKSYGAWHHRFWAMEFSPEPDWKRELKLCGYFLTQDERNFHCWDYRRLICKKCEVTHHEELAFSTELIESNFSNYSAWHYRSTLLPIVHPGSLKGSLNEEVLLKELELIQNAAFTDPNDQSVWFYHRWLLGRNKIPLQILNVSIIHPQKIAVLLSESFMVANDCMKLQVNKNFVDAVWKPVPSFSPASTVWICDVQESINLESDNCEITVELSIGKSTDALSCCINGNKPYSWKKTSRADAFRSELSAATKEVLTQELESCQQLNELEPNCKWTLFTCILLMRALNDKIFETKIADYMKSLKEIDHSRVNYYNDLESKFIIENVIEDLPVDATEVDLSNRRLTSLHHFDQFILIEKIDLSSNCLTSVVALCYLINAKVILLDDNKLTNLDGLQELHIKSLSVKKNLINETRILEALETSQQLQELFIEDNPVLNDPDYLFIVKKFSKLKIIDGRNL